MAGTKMPGAMTREMIMVHTAFLREFGNMPQLVRAVAEGDRKRTEIVADHIELMSTSLHRHHEGEDEVIWPRLLVRCPEEIRPLVHGMEKQHERIAAQLTALGGQLAAWRAEAGAASRDAVHGTLTGMLPVLREHLGMEVDYVLPLIEKHITADEWDAMVAGISAEYQPDRLTLLFGLMMYEGDPASIQDAFDTMPVEVRPAIAEMAPRMYADYAERVYGTRTPPRLSAPARAA